MIKREDLKVGVSIRDANGIVWVVMCIIGDEVAAIRSGGNSLRAVLNDCVIVPPGTCDTTNYVDALQRAQATIAARDATITELSDQKRAAEHAAKGLKREVDTLRQYRIQGVNGNFEGFKPNDVVGFHPIEGFSLNGRNIGMPASFFIDHRDTPSHAYELKEIQMSLGNVPRAVFVPRPHPTGYNFRHQFRVEEIPDHQAFRTRMAVGKPETIYRNLKVGERTSAEKQDEYQAKNGSWERITSAYTIKPHHRPVRRKVGL